MCKSSKPQFTLTRRSAILGISTAVTAAALTGPAWATAGLAGKKLVFVMLRGGTDGLGLVAPTADPYYAGLRAYNAMSASELLPMGGGLGLNPRMTSLHAMMQAGEALAIHGVGAPYLTRSHFDSQDGLEKGAARLGDARDGWINRLIGVLGLEFEGIAIGTNIPTLLRGNNEIVNYAPARLPKLTSDTMNRMKRLTAPDDVIGATVGQAVDDELAGLNELDVGDNASDFEIAGELLNNVDSQHAGMAVVEMDGWDTHINAGPLDDWGVGGLVSYLDGHLQILKDTLGTNWDNTVVIAVSEFGRMAATNSSGGFDHGTGGVCFVLGGGVNGNSGGTVGSFPGLAPGEMFEGRDVYPVIDSRSIFKGILRDFLGAGLSDLNNVVFPDSASVSPFDNLVS